MAARPSTEAVVMPPAIPTPGYLDLKGPSLPNQPAQTPAHISIEFQNGPVTSKEPNVEWEREVKNLNNQTITLKQSEFDKADTTKPEVSCDTNNEHQTLHTDEETTPGPKSVAEICQLVVGILERYRLPLNNDYSKQWGAKATFLAQVERSVTRNEPVRMALPAFPFKSPNRKTKVLGVLPDKGEEIALLNLEGLCSAIEDVYEHGANVYIVSDGLMYNDILGVSDREVWRYGQALRQLAQDCNCAHLRFVRLHHLLGGGEFEEPLTEEAYLQEVPRYRNTLIQRYLPTGFDPVAQIATDPDTTCTYRGYIKFLETDLADSSVMTEAKTKAQVKNKLEDVAKQMIVRGKAFATSIANNLSDYVRLSIHPSTGTSKLSMSLIPQEGRVQTPWHSALVRAVDGTITMSHADQISAKTHELIFKDGRPSYFRERSDLFDWPGMDVEFDYIHPCGIMITPRDKSTKYSLHNVRMQKVRGLSEACSPVILRGFADTTDAHVFEAKAYDAGTVAPWVFGVKQAVKDLGSTDAKASTVTSSEAMPMHYDGFFFLKKQVDESGNEKMVSQVPRFQYFTCVTSSPPGSGYTLFASSQLFFKHLPAPYTVSDLEKLTWSCRHSSNWNNLMDKLPLVVRHPTTGKPCIRWHEPWAKWQTKFSYNEITIENGEQSYKELINSLLYDRRVCLYYQFQQGDILVADNISLMHTRTAFNGKSGRELWRIHFN